MKLVEFVLIFIVSLAVWLGGSLHGQKIEKARVKDHIIQTCVAKNPDMANSKINAYCEDKYNSIFEKVK